MVGGLPRPVPRKRGVKPRPREEIRSERLILRAHPDLIALLSERAAERGISRSAFIEGLLIAWLRADPRNPRLDPVGRIITTDPQPRKLRETDPIRFAQRWERFNQAHMLLMGQSVRQDWLDELNSYWPSAYGDMLDKSPDPEEEFETRPSKKKGK